MHTDDAAIDQMLADHDAKHGGDLDELLRQQIQRFANTHGVTISQGAITIEPTPEPRERRPRNVWPVHARRWTRADRQERWDWVRKLYGDQGLTVAGVADLLGLPANTIQTDVTTLGIQRRHIGVGATRQRRLAERRAKVRQLYEVDGYSMPVIAEMLGVEKSTINKDVRDEGYQQGTPRLSDKALVTQVTRAIGQLDTMARFLLDNPEFEVLRVTPEQATEWEKPLARIVRSVSRVRKAMKGDT